MAEIRQLPARLNVVRAPENQFVLLVTVTDSNIAPIDVSAWQFDGDNIQTSIVDGPAGKVAVQLVSSLPGTAAWGLRRTAPEPLTLLAGSDRVTNQTQRFVEDAKLTFDLSENLCLTVEVEEHV